MSRPIIVAVWKRLLSSPARLVLLAIGMLLPLLAQASASKKYLTDSNSIVWIILIVGAGAIGQDVSTGVLQLLFVRPLRRRSYVLSKWLAVSIGSCAFALVDLLRDVITISVSSRPTLADFMLNATERALFSFGLGAVLLCLSSVASGLGDVVLWLFLLFGCFLLRMGGASGHVPDLESLGKELAALVTPHLDLTEVFGSRPVSLHPLFGYAFAVTLSLGLAIRNMNRKDISYAQQS